MALLTDHSQPRPVAQKRKKPGLPVRAFTLPEMGGSAFTSEPYLLNTPRMQPTVYHRVKSACHARLRELYLCVASPIEGPAKEDHGDIDIVVALERQAFFPSDSGPQLSHPRTGYEPLKTIAAALGAEHVIYLEPHLVSANMAIPWSEDINDIDNTDTGTDQPQQRRHIQVDIHIAQSFAEFQWRLFRHAHGDFFQLVGTTIRSLGLTIDEQALWIRIPEIEASDRKRAKIFLTSDPEEILQFLGFKGYLNLQDRADEQPHSSVPHAIADDDTGSPTPRSVWERPFDTVVGLFDYVATCRWFWVTPQEPGQEIGEDGYDASMRSNDRRRMKQRPVYQQWKEEYLPSLWPSVRDGTFANQEFNLLFGFDRRRVVREAAFARWPDAGARYMERFHAWHLQIVVEHQQREIMELIRKAVAMEDENQNWHNVAVAALKKIVFFGDSSFGIMPPVPLRDSEGLFDVCEAERFIAKNCKHVGDAAWKLMCARGARSMKEKALKKAMAMSTLEMMENGVPDNSDGDGNKGEGRCHT